LERKWRNYLGQFWIGGLDLCGTRLAGIEGRLHYFPKVIFKKDVLHPRKGGILLRLGYINAKSSPYKKGLEHPNLMGAR